MRFWAALVAVLVAMYAALNVFAGDNCKAGAACGDKAAATAQVKSVAAEGDACCPSKAGDKAATARLVAAEGDACCPGDKAKDVAHKHKHEVSADRCQSQCGEKIAGSIPAMKFTVGDQTVTCPGEALDLADGNETRIKYVVGKETYTDQRKALQAYAAQLEECLDTMTKVQYVIGDDTTCCPQSADALAKKSGKPVHYRVALVDFASKDRAAEAAKLAATAAEKVALKCMVGDKEYSCTEAASEACKKAGGEAKVAWCLGETKTECEQTARVMLLRARITAAAEAVARLTETAQATDRG